ncbi:MAG: DUF1698 domain-containing protein, partial [Leptonema sp. (in: Bacteria)]|nr:DUF1698 domain-containing protein [Leptonema sp. (in: bacteria)]
MTASVTIQDGVFVIERESVNPSEIESKIIQLGPFRKGPFRIDGVNINSHWLSDVKWQYMLPIFERPEFRSLLSKPNLRFIDVGSNNGYYLFRLIHWLQKTSSLLNAEPLFLAIDPVEQFEAQFQFLHKILYEYPIRFERIGWQQVESLAQFDTILCMGVLYHQTDPISMLRSFYHSLNQGGWLILETMIIPSVENNLPVSLTPPRKYAGSSGVWFVPTKEALLNLLQRTGWRHIQIESIRPALDEQQRFGDFPAFREVLNSSNINETIEG